MVCADGCGTVYKTTRGWAHAPMPMQGTYLKAVYIGWEGCVARVFHSACRQPLRAGGPLASRGIVEGPCQLNISHTCLAGWKAVPVLLA